jgi:predicted O-methyltransferase YrrM
MRGKAALHCLKYFLGLESAFTQTTESERQLLAQYARASSRLVEIGVFEGVTTRVIADAMPDTANLFAVDPFFKGPVGVCWGEVIARWEVSKTRGKSVRFVKALSEDASKLIEGNFDLIFVDADHSLPGFEKDWNTWRPRCIVGGVMAFHDTRAAPHAPQVRAFGSFEFYNNVIKLNPDFREIDSIDTLSVVKRIR